MMNVAYKEFVGRFVIPIRRVRRDRYVRDEFARLDAEMIWFARAIRRVSIISV